VHEEVKPSANAITAARHAIGLPIGRHQKPIELAIFAGLDAANMACHNYHATARLQFMLVSGKVETACSGCTKKVENLLLHEVV